MGTGSRITRRRLLGTMGALAASKVLRNARAADHVRRTPADTVAGADQPHVLALIGDRYHNSDYIRVALGRLFRELNLLVDFTINFQEISASRLQNYRLLVVFRDGLNWPKGYLGPDSYPYAGDLENSEDWPKEQYEGWISEEQGKAIKEFVQAGNGLYAYHNSSNISLFSRNFRDVMGGAYIDHPPLRPFRVKVANREHPILRGAQGFMVNDEQHYVTFDKDPKDIILTSENVDGLNFGASGTTAISGWAYDYGKGRVAFTAVGHTIHALWQPEYFKIQKNAVRWLLRMS